MNQHFSLTKRGSATPHPAGPVIFRPTGARYELISECSCTDWPLHYLVKLDNGGLLTVQHSEIQPAKK